MPKIGRRQATVLLSIAVLLAASGARAGGPASFPTHHETIPNFAQNDHPQRGERHLVLRLDLESRPRAGARPTSCPSHTVTYDSCHGRRGRDRDRRGRDASLLDGRGARA